MRAGSNRKSIAFFIAFGACLVALSIALNVGWILLNWRQVAQLVFGVVFFAAIITGLILNTVFLVREIRRNEQHDAFINSVTHELKTPIASIRLYLETLQAREVEDQRRKEFYGIMLADTDRLLHTVEQVLRAGQIGQRRRSIDRTPIDVGEVVRDCLAIAQTRLAGKEGSFQYAERFCDDRLPFVLGDADELRVAVSNLIDNAVKYSDNGVSVSVEVATEPRRVAVRVSDQGIGIPQAQLKQVFKRFYRVPGRRAVRAKGTGLGLFIVRSVVDRHGGRTFAESAGEGRGSTFVIQLPRA